MRSGLIFLAFIISLTSFAQPGNRGQQMTGRFYGKVVDASNRPIDAASVVLVQDRMDSATKQRKEVVVNGMLTAANGEFSLENIPAMGRYKLRVSGIGFKQHEAVVNFDRPQGSDPSAMMSALDKDLGNIRLDIDDKVLENVTVTSSRPQLTLGIDRKVFNVDKNIVSAGGTAIDVMRNVPSINVDVDGNVSLRNNAPQIFVDGRPTNLTLEQIPADAIESVEIITNPSAKFDASGGTAGILNIVLKKQKRVGYAGNIRANLDSRGRVGGGGDINIRQGKINFFASSMINQRKSISEGTTTRRTFTNPQLFSRQEDDNEMNGLFGFGRAGFDFFISNRNTITLSGTMSRGHMEPSNYSDIFTDTLSSTPKYTLTRQLAEMEMNHRNYGSQLSFKHNFPKAGHEWTADVTFNEGNHDNFNDITRNFFDRTTGNPEGRYAQRQTTEGKNRNLVFQTDYAKPISDKSKFEIGARASHRTFESAQDFLFKQSNDSYVPLPGRNIIYNSTDNVYAAYTTFSNRIKDFGYQLGFRVESSDYSGVLENKNQSFNVEFPISLFPSVFVSQKLSDATDIQLNYSRRINRPNFWQLFPFTDSADQLNISRGNPNLKPEFTNSIELSLSHQFKNRDNFIASAYFKNTNDLITRFQSIERDSFQNRDVIVNSFINANRSFITGLELTSRNKITKFWDLTSNANFFTAKIDVADQPDEDQFLSYFFKINNSFKLPKNITFQLSGDYMSRIISAPSGGGGGRMGGGGFGGGQNTAAQGYIRPNYSVDAALRYEFLKNRVASLSLNVNDIFKTRKYDAHTEQAGVFIQDIERRRDWQVFRLNFNYRFGKFDASLFKRRSNRAEDMPMEGPGMKP